jgi:diaminopropionate ammonia-lyase
MILANVQPEHGHALDPADAALLGLAGAEQVEHVLAHRPGHRPTPLHALPGLAADLGLGSLHVKDEGFRLGLGSFKALGGAYAVVRLVLEEAGRRGDREIGVEDLHSPHVRAVAADMTFACATDGNHGRSVAQGAGFVGARAVIFVHGGVSEERVAAIARFGADIRRVAGTYDDSVREAARVAGEHRWTILSDTSWPGYERIPGLVMQGYTAMLREALRALPAPPTHVFVQAGVGGVAAALAGHLAILYGASRPRFVVVEPVRAACLFESARAGHIVQVPHGEATVMAMLECYEPSLVAWRILSRAADAFMEVDEEDAVAVMNRLARPMPGDPAVVAGESGGAGLAGVIRAARDSDARRMLGLDASSRVLAFITEGATDPGLYHELVGLTPEAVLATNSALGGRG